MTIVIVTDAWFPQVSGVVRTLNMTVQELEKQGHRPVVISPDRFRTVPCPTYPEIRLAITTSGRVGRLIQQSGPEAIHLATEGPLGLAARRYCVRRRLPFTTSYTTKFPEYIYARTRIPTSLTYRLVRWFHGPARGVMVATESMRRELEEKGFTNIVRWTRGVDTELFRPRDKSFLDAPRPVSMYVGRVAVEKSIEDFLKLDLPGTKFVVGSGPQLEELKRKHPEARFVGAKHGEELAQYYAAADVFVFPSRTDTFGLVMLEALASGVPVAAYPVTGPIDVIGESEVGVLDNDLAAAVRKALDIPPDACREYALRYSWKNVASLFVANLHPIGGGRNRQPKADRAREESRPPEPADQPAGRP
jgi:glycosyltransferase involved in cell wall biosynthesis